MWLRRQKVQQVLARLTLIEGIERTNTVVVRNPLQEQGGRGEKIRRNSYVIDVDRERNCYSCGKSLYKNFKEQLGAAIIKEGHW